MRMRHFLFQNERKESRHWNLFNREALNALIQVIGDIESYLRIRWCTKTFHLLSVNGVEICGSSIRSRLNASTTGFTRKRAWYFAFLCLFWWRKRWCHSPNRDKSSKKRAIENGLDNIQKNWISSVRNTTKSRFYAFSDTIVTVATQTRNCSCIVGYRMSCSIDSLTRVFIS